MLHSLRPLWPLTCQDRVTPGAGLRVSSRERQLGWHGPGPPPLLGLGTGHLSLQEQGHVPRDIGPSYHVVVLGPHAAARSLLPALCLPPISPVGFCRPHPTWCHTVTPAKFGSSRKTVTCMPPSSCVETKQTNPGAVEPPSSEGPSAAASPRGWDFAEQEDSLPVDRKTLLCMMG